MFLNIIEERLKMVKRKIEHECKLLFNKQDWMNNYLKKNKSFYPFMNEDYEKLIRINTILEGKGYEHDHHFNAFQGQIKVLGTILNFNSSTILGINKDGDKLIEFEKDFIIKDY